MKIDTAKNKVLARGLHSLLAPGKGLHWEHLDDCEKYMLECSEHPFGLPMPPPDVGCSHRDISICKCNGNVGVQVFLASVRYWVGIYDGYKVTGLRVIDTQIPDGRPGQHYVFFELETLNKNIISGTTTNFGGGDNDAREELESVFALLSAIYSVEIQRVLDVRDIELEELYAKEKS